MKLHKNIKKAFIVLLAVFATSAAKGEIAAASDSSPKAISKKISELFLTADPARYKPVGYRGGKAYGGGEIIHYATVSLWVNALECARISGDADLEARLVAAFAKYRPGAGKPGVMNDYRHVDLAIVGAIPLEIAILTGDAQAAELGLGYARRQWAEPQGDEDWGDRWYDKISPEERVANWQKGYSPQTRFWIDDMYMITFLQSQAYRLTGDYSYISRSAREMALYLDKLQREDGLFNHAPSAPFAWGRGNGWMAAAMAINLKYMKPDDPNRQKIITGYLKMMSALIRNQRESGLWGQIVDDPESWDETSASAMFAYALEEGENLGIFASLDAATWEVRPHVDKAYAALVSRLDEYGNIDDVCVGTGWRNDRNHYMKRPRSNGDPHGQAPMLWLCGALMQRDKAK